MVIKKKVILFIEGESNSPNGDLRQGFAKLLEKLLGQNLPSIKLGDGKTQTIKKFLKNQLPCDLALLLIDLDKPESEIAQDLIQHQLTEHKENVFYMIQEMENWFLSQPEILDQYYGKDKNGKSISEKLSKRKPSEIPNADEVLQQLTKNTEKPAGMYHKIKHGVDLLKLLDAHKLAKDFPEYQRLINRLA